MLPNPIESDLATRLNDPDAEVRRIAVMELPYSDEDDILPLLLTMPLLARGLNGLMLGEAEAYHLGIPVQRIKALAILLVALAVGASVASAGLIGFVGIVVPHLIRLSVGPDHRLLLPLSALGGAILLVAADIAARLIVAPAELPIGIVTAAIGAPFFLWLLLRRAGGSLDV